MRNGSTLLAISPALLVIACSSGGASLEEPCLIDAVPPALDYAQIDDFPQFEDCLMDVARALGDVDEFSDWLAAEGWSIEDMTRRPDHPKYLGKRDPVWVGNTHYDTPRISGSARFEEYQERHPDFRPAVGLWKPYGMNVHVTWPEGASEPEPILTQQNRL